MEQNYQLAVKLANKAMGCIEYNSKIGLFTLTFPNFENKIMQEDLFLGFGITSSIQNGKKRSLSFYEPMIFKKNIDDYLSDEKIGFYKTNLLSMPRSGIDVVDKNKFVKLVYQELPKISQRNDFDEFTNLIKNKHINVSNTLFNLYEKLI
jgi:hypothetical protein